MTLKSRFFVMDRMIFKKNIILIPNFIQILFLDKNGEFLHFFLIQFDKLKKQILI